MPGMEEFLSLFGNVPLTSLAYYALAGGFIVKIYMIVKNYFVSAHDAEKERDKQIQEALDASKEATSKFEEVDNKLKEVTKTQNDIIEQNKALMDGILKRERNRIRGELIKLHKHYTNKENNPNMLWTRMEADAFWEMFHDYEEAGGDGYIHTKVQPDMEALDVIEI